MSFSEGTEAVPSLSAEDVFGLRDPVKMCDCGDVR